MELSLFEEVAEVARGLVPRKLGVLRARCTKWSAKVWFDTDVPTKLHYEAQVVGPRWVVGAKVLALEIGFHAEHPKEAANEAALERLLARERTWRKALGAEAEAGVFLGRAGNWRRVSETWPDPDLGEPGLAIEVGTRLTDYVCALEPLLH